MAIFNNALGMLIAAALFIFTWKHRGDQGRAVVVLAFVFSVLLFLYALGGFFAN